MITSPGNSKLHVVCLLVGVFFFYKNNLSHTEFGLRNFTVFLTLWSKEVFPPLKHDR